jgi:subtilisin family serine protease
VTVAVFDYGVDGSHEDLNVACGYDALRDAPDTCPCTF